MSQAKTNLKKTELFAALLAIQDEVSRRKGWDHVGDFQSVLDYLAHTYPVDPEHFRAFLGGYEVE